jgi:NTE family protein
VRLRTTAALLAVLVSAACAHYEVNPRVATPTVDPQHGYRFGTTNDAGQGDETFVIVTFSGGGTRAAALAYGVLQKLAATTIKGGDLLGTVDIVSSVSGGSFTAAYYALHGREGLPTFKSVFLDQNIQKELIRRAANPLNWPKLLSPRYSRIDLAQDLYDEKVFKGATFAQMPKTGRPFTILNATEMDVGNQFTFTQEQFDGICSDLDKLRVSRGVAASSAFPGALTPVILRSYTSGGGCGYNPGTWYTLASDDFLTNARRWKFRNDLSELIRPDRPYIHLSDGGVADNIGLRNGLHAIASQDTLQMNDTHPVFGYSVLRLLNLRKINKVAIIVVNAKTENELKVDKSEKTPGLAAMIGSASGTPLSNYSFDTVELARMELGQLTTDARAAAEQSVARFPQAKYYLIQVTFAAIKDPKEREKFNRMGTNFGLPPAEITELLAIGPRLLDESPVFQQLVKDLK